MSLIARYKIIQIHMMLAAFLMPIAIMYFISGALYSLEIKGHVDKQIIPLQLNQPFIPNLDLLSQISKQALLDRSLPLPSGEPELKKNKGSYELRWSDLKYAVKLRPTRNPMTVNLTFRERSLLTQVMRIHRAEAGSVFKVFTFVMVAGLIIMFASGIYMAQTIPKFRRPTLLAIAAGFITFLTLTLLH